LAGGSNGVRLVAHPNPCLEGQVAQGSDGLRGIEETRRFGGTIAQQHSGHGGFSVASVLLKVRVIGRVDHNLPSRAVVVVDIGLAKVRVLGGIRMGLSAVEIAREERVDRGAFPRADEGDDRRLAALLA
jgi:hypothetical protein